MENPSENNNVAQNPLSTFVFSATKLPTDTDPNPSEQEISDTVTKRMLSNRLYARRSKVKREIRMAKLEVQKKIYEDQVAKLQSSAAFYNDRRESQIVEIEKLKSDIESLNKCSLLKDDEMEKCRREVDELIGIRMSTQQEAVSNYSIPNSFPGNYVVNPFGSYMPPASYTQPEPSVMQFPTSVPNLHETYLTMPNINNNMDQMNNLTWGIVPPNHKP